MPGPDWEHSYLQCDTGTTAVLTACHLCRTQSSVSPVTYTIQQILTAEADRFIALCSAQWVRCWLIFSEGLTNWPARHIATASHALTRRLPSGSNALKKKKQRTCLVSGPESWKDSFHVPGAEPAPTHLCLPLFLSLSPSLSNPPPPA